MVLPTLRGLASVPVICMRTRVPETALALSFTRSMTESSGRRDENIPAFHKTFTRRLHQGLVLKRGGRMRAKERERERERERATEGK
jgi:hypothetical protein